MKQRMRYFVLMLFLIGLLSSTASATSPEPAMVEVPMIMYHSLTGSGGSTSISVEAFEMDLKYLQENGFEAVTLSQLADFVHHAVPLPKRPVVLSFDDGYYNNYALGVPLAEAYQMPMVIAVIGKDTALWSINPSEDMRHGHVTWTEISQMVESGFVEIANHTWDLHKNECGRRGASIRVGEDISAYHAVLREDIGRLQEALTEYCGVTPIAFVYPFGAICPEASELLEELGFLLTLSCEEGINKITQGDAACLYNLKRYNRTAERSVEEIFALF